MLNVTNFLLISSASHIQAALIYYTKLYSILFNVLNLRRDTVFHINILRPPGAGVFIGRLLSAHMPRHIFHRYYLSALHIVYEKIRFMHHKRYASYKIYYYYIYIWYTHIYGQADLNVNCAQTVLSCVLCQKVSHQKIVEIFRYVTRSIGVPVGLLNPHKNRISTQGEYSTISIFFMTISFDLERMCR